MRVWVSSDRCQGHLRCIQAVPEIFQEDEQGHSYTLGEDVPSGFEAGVMHAVRNCPEQAISVGQAGEASPE